eukprot:9027098-Alexandrium_andersonii.AAC.1
MTDSSRSPRGRGRTPEEVQPRRAANVAGSPGPAAGHERGRRFRRDGARREGRAAAGATSPRTPGRCRANGAGGRA